MKGRKIYLGPFGRESGLDRWRYCGKCSVKPFPLMCHPHLSQWREATGWKGKPKAKRKK